MSDGSSSSFRMYPIEDGESLLDRVTAVIRKAIVDGEIAPGVRLSVPELARQLNVSRTPAREALLRLQHEGLVDVTPRRGAIVMDGKPSDMVELYQFREALEGMAARLAATTMTEAQKAELRTAFEAHARAIHDSDMAGHIEHDREFHELFISGSGNGRIAGELARVRDQLTLFTRRMSARPDAMTVPIVEAHEAILTAIEEGRARDAESAARGHVRAILAFYGDEA